MNANDIRSTITSTIIESLEAGGLPAWRKPWAADPNGLGLATSLSTGKPYNGINQLLLQVLAMKRGYQSKWFGTFQQIKQAGASVQKGAKAVQVVLFRPVSRERTNEMGEQVEDKFLVMRTFNVFNVEQTTGLDQFRIGYSQPSHTIFERFESMDRLVAAVGIDVRHGGNRAFYSPGGDYIQMPHRHQFESSETYYQTLAHEMTHWSESRIGFDRAKEENAYALGELVAELGASFLLAELGLPASENIDNCTRYLDHWLKAMRGDTRFIFKAAATASKAVDLLLSHVRQPEQRPVPVSEEVGTC
ncbi:zincin-like metallopeptidase domain-containing protein [Bremerella sp. JC817]|uniref:ArdC family protein n=1 Tax=Bremerella sp. JC817 TaxID=3231756 RepID=UPI003457D67F